MSDRIVVVQICVQDCAGAPVTPLYVLERPARSPSEADAIGTALAGDLLDRGFVRTPGQP